MVTQTKKREKNKKIDNPPTPLNITTDDATCISTPIDIDKKQFFLQQVPIVVQQPPRLSSSLVQVLLENTSILELISTLSYRILLKTYDFVKQVSIYIFSLMIE